MTFSANHATWDKSFRGLGDNMSFEKSNLHAGRGELLPADDDLPGVQVVDAAHDDGGDGEGDGEAGYREEQDAHQDGAAGRTRVQVPVKGYCCHKCQCFFNLSIFNFWLSVSAWRAVGSPAAPTTARR